MNLFRSDGQSLDPTVFIGLTDRGDSHDVVATKIGNEFCLLVINDLMFETMASFIPFNLSSFKSSMIPS